MPRIHQRTSLKSKRAQAFVRIAVGTHPEGRLRWIKTAEYENLRVSADASGDYTHTQARQILVIRSRRKGRLPLERR